MQQFRGPVHTSVLSRRALLSALSLLPAARFLTGRPLQQAAPPPQFSSNVKVVNVFATVRDKQGQIIQNLTKNDFVLEEDGRPQMIRYFAQQSDLPLTLGLLVDTSGSERRMLGTERDASYTFLQQVLRPDRDKAFLIHFDRDVELLQDLTSSRQKLEKALDLLDRPEWGNNGNNQGGDGGNGGYGSVEDTVGMDAAAGGMAVPPSTTPSIWLRTMFSESRPGARRLSC